MKYWKLFTPVKLPRSMFVGNSILVELEVCWNILVIVVQGEKSTPLPIIIEGKALF